MKFHSCIYTNDEVTFAEGADEIITLASMSKWFYLGYFFDHFKDTKFQEFVDDMMFHSSNEATKILALIFTPDKLQEYAGKFSPNIFITNSAKSIESKRSNESSLADLSKFLYYLASEHPEIEKYKSSIHKIIAESLKLKSFANKPGSSSANKKYFLGDSLILFSEERPVVISAVIETFNPHLTWFPLKVFKKILVMILKNHVKRQLKSQLELQLTESLSQAKPAPKYDVSK